MKILKFRTADFHLVFVFFWVRAGGIREDLISEYYFGRRDSTIIIKLTHDM